MYEDDYNLWHSLEHMPERLAVSGFIRAIRCIGIKNTLLENKYFMMYEVENKSVFTSSEYINRLNNPTTWTKKILSGYISPSRTICELVYSKSLTDGICSNFGTIRFLSKNLNLQNFYDIDLADLKLMNIMGVHIFNADKRISNLKSKEKILRKNQGKEDEIIESAILIEGMKFQSIENFINTKLEINDNKYVIINFYRLQHIIENSI